MTLQAQEHPAVDGVLAHALSGACPLYLLFPGPDAVSLDALPPFEPSALQPPPQQQQQKQQQQQPGEELLAGSPPSASGVPPTAGTGAPWPPDSPTPPKYVLLCVDGTWR